MAGGRLIFDKHTENLAEISMVYARLTAEYPKLMEDDSIAWKQMFVEWANEFEEEYPDLDELGADYQVMIELYAKEKIFEYAGIEMKPYYFTFGSWERFPYQNTYLVVYGIDMHDALKKYRSKYPDVHQDTVNCSSWYNEEQWKEVLERSKGRWYNEPPAEVIR